MRGIIGSLCIVLVVLGGAWAGQNAVPGVPPKPTSGKGMVAKTDIRLKVEGLVSMTPDIDLGQLATALKGLEACVCAPLTPRFDLQVIPISCQCRKKGVKWEIKP